MTFRVGMKVVCVEYDSRGEPPPYPVVGKVYTIANCYIDEDDLMLELEEIPFPADVLEDWLPGFVSTGFRPVVERKTDIGFAHEILKKVTRKQTERA